MYSAPCWSCCSGTIGRTRPSARVGMGSRWRSCHEVDQRWVHLRVLSHCPEIDPRWTHEYEALPDLTDCFWQPKISRGLLKLLPIKEKHNQLPHGRLGCPHEWPNGFMMFMRCFYDHFQTSEQYEACTKKVTWRKVNQPRLPITTYLSYSIVSQLLTGQRLDNNSFLLLAFISYNIPTLVYHILLNNRIVRPFK